MCVDFQPPLEDLKNIYTSLQYSLRIRSNSVERTQVLYQKKPVELPPLLLSTVNSTLPVVILTASFICFQNAKFLRRQVLENLSPGREYCVSVRFADSLVQRTSGYGTPVCDVAPGGHAPGTRAALIEGSSLLVQY